MDIKKSIQDNYFYKRLLIRTKTFLVSGYKYKAEINPFRILWVNPNQIIYRAKFSDYEIYRDLCYVIGGDWDLSQRLFRDKPIVKMMYEHFEYGVEWNKTNQYKVILLDIQERGESWTHCSSEADVEARCEYVDNLFYEIKENGYKVPEGCSFGKTGLTRSNNSDEIVVNIGRTGGIYYHDGKHRLTIAKILNLPLIPVRVLVRHKQWQDFREEIVDGRYRKSDVINKESKINHPDITYLLKFYNP